jgi:hypothetical protein
MSARTLSVLVFLILGLQAFARPARAENPNVVFSGRIIVSDKKFPKTATSPSAYVAAIRKQAKTNFPEDKEKKGTWKVYIAGFLKTKLDDLEYVVKIYDVSTKNKQMLQAIDMYTNDRGEQTIISSVTLDKQTVGVNKELMITMESKNKVLASGTFKVLGEGEKFTGKVNFSDDDTKKDE